MADPDHVPMITGDGPLRSVCNKLREGRRFAFDTEFVSEHTFEPQLCLIQVATADHLAVIDPLGLRDLSPFWDALLDPEVEVVMHAAGEDLRITRLKTGALPARVFDVQLAAGLVGFGYPLSLGNLLYQALGVSVSGGETRTDWRKRPLSDGQVRYAADDVRYLLELADLLKDRLDAMGRSAWAEREMEDALASVRERGDDDERWRRLPGLHQLSRRGLEVARRLATWREDQARASNRPLRSLLRDDLLVATAKRQPRNRRDLEALRDFNRPGLMGQADAILAQIAGAQDVAADALPEHAERPDDAPGATMVAGLLGATLQHLCAGHRVAPALVGTGSDLRELIRWSIGGEPDDARPALLQGWRGEIFGRTLLDVLEGRRALRVVDPAAEVPIALDGEES